MNYVIASLVVAAGIAALLSHTDKNARNAEQNALATTADAALRAALDATAY